MYVYGAWIGFLGEHAPLGFLAEFLFTTALGNCFGYGQLYVYRDKISVGYI